jgi:hypothetical protein
MNPLQAAQTIARLQRVRRMNIPLIDDYDTPVVFDLPKTELPLPETVPQPSVSPMQPKQMRTVSIAGLQVAHKHPSGVYYDEKSESVVGPGISSMLGLRVLRSYLHPDNVKAREEERKAHPENAWREMRPIEKERSVGWARCAFCWENTWCLVTHSEQRVRTDDERICEECFYEDMDFASC